MTLAMMLYLAPSLARVSVKPTWPNFAALSSQSCRIHNERPRKVHTRVVSLSEIAEQTSGRSSVDDTAILLLAEMRESSSCALFQPKELSVVVLRERGSFNVYLCHACLTLYAP